MGVASVLLENFEVLRGPSLVELKNFSEVLLAVLVELVDHLLEDVDAELAVLGQFAVHQGHDYE